MEAGPADAVAEQKGSLLPHGQGPIAGFMAKGHCLGGQALKNLAPDVKGQFIKDLRGPGRGSGVLVRAPLKGHHPQTGISQFLGHDGPGKTHTHDNRVNRFHIGSHSQPSCCSMEIGPWGKAWLCRLTNSR